VTGFSGPCAVGTAGPGSGPSFAGSPTAGTPIAYSQRMRALPTLRLIIQVVTRAEY
jgi:hypothetical protein